MTRDIEAALNKIVNTTEQSGNMRKELKKTIYETVSTLRNLFVTLKVQLEGGKSENGRLESELRDTKIMLNERKKESEKVDTERRPETSSDRGGEHSTPGGGQVLPPHKHSPKRNYKLYSDIVAGREEKKFMLTLRSKGNHTPGRDNKSTEKKK